MHRPYGGIQGNLRLHRLFIKILEIPKLSDVWEINEPLTDQTLPDLSLSPFKFPVSIADGDGIQQMSQNRPLGDHLASTQLELVVDDHPMVGNEMEFFQRPKSNICALVRTHSPF